MKSCEEFELLASLAVDEEATLEERAELAKHLETCPDCRAYFEDLKRLHEAFAVEKPIVPEDFAAQVMCRVRETKQDRAEEPEKKTVLFPHWRRWAALAACCAVAALGVWATGNFGGVKDVMNRADDADMVAAQDARTAQEPSERRDAAEDAGGTGAAAMSDEAPPLPEEYGDAAKSYARESLEESKSQPQDGGSTEWDLDVSSSAGPEYATGGEEAAAFPVAAENGNDRMDAAEAADVPASEDNMELEEETENSEPLPSPAKPLEPDEIAPVEVIGVPDPGILIAFGGTAQGWVENTLGLEWTDGGSYPLTAEQYADLIQTLDQAGEPYSIEPGEGYCLMTE
ncbi:MAG: zf-HC2 domain-containing protein [Oscillospiraceae bacterium]|nr:zf-HC2 domain-containing protein [Oscillospiraceae bacterium]